MSCLSTVDVTIGGLVEFDDSAIVESHSHNDLTLNDNDGNIRVSFDLRLTA